MKKLILIVLLSLAGISAFPRAVRLWSEQELQAASQLIVIGTVTNVTDLNEINNTLWPGGCKLRGLEATFVVSKVLKGEFTNHTVVLHYYRWDTPFPTSDPGSTMGPDVNSPELIYLTPKSTNEFVLFLIDDGPSRYAPASGQLDTAGESVRNLGLGDVKGDPQFSGQLATVLEECQSIKPGMARWNLLRIFTTEGGLSTPRHRTYIWRGCPYVKVDVDFNPSDPKQDAHEEQPTDVITKISKPYLDWTVSD